MTEETEPKRITIDDLCEQPPGTFKKFIHEKEANLEALETERKNRIHAAQETEQQKIERVAKEIYDDLYPPPNGWPDKFAHHIYSHSAKWHLARVAALESQLAEANKVMSEIHSLSRTFKTTTPHQLIAKWSGDYLAIDAARKGGPR